ncbi:putative ABC transport system permease protein [Lentzea fradiae]|uniref:Putative ABC transport system permease protein n=1 Tax=Lentzea fradiae TaxID=200378 RepID=A0A1G7QZB2_9PSEU|nr:FtsX-like permease family protein [Lentzea fradiae]SDG03851.1 putative ABC transport system permease protein [Lentzea fradiae]
MALDATMLVSRSLMRSWYFRPARLAAAIAAGIAGVLLTTAVLVVYFAVYDALRGAPITAVRDEVVAVEASAPAGLAPSVVDEVGQRTGLPTTSMLVVSASRLQDDGTTTPMLVFGVEPELGDFVDDDLAEQTREHPLGPGEVYLAAAWADQRGVKAGDEIRVGGTTDVRTWKVAAILRGEVANRGSVIIAPRPVVAEAFGRGEFTDVVLVDQRGQDRARVVADATAAVDGAAAVKDPKDLLSGYRKSFQTFLTILAMFAVIAVLTAGVVLYLTWRLALDDARPALARMRLTGVRTSHLMAGSAAVMVPILLVSYAIGVVLGVLVGSRLDSFSRQITDLSQQAVTPGTPWQLPALGALLAVVLMFLAAWVSGVRRFTKVEAIEAVSGRGEVAVLPGGVRKPFLLGAGLLVTGVLVVLLGPPLVQSVGLVPLLGGAALLSVVLPVVIGLALRKGEPGPVRLAVSRQLQLGWRRNAALCVTFTVSVVSAVGMAGVAGSIRHEVAASVERWTPGDLYVQAAPLGTNLRNETLPRELEQELRAVDGVEAVTTFSFTYLELDGRRVQVWSWARSDLDRLSRLTVTEGPADVLTLLGQDDIAVSVNYADAQGVEVGDRLDLPLPTGHRSVTIKAVVDDSASDGGMLIASPELYAELTGSTQVYAFFVGVGASADKAVVRDALAAVVSDAHPRSRVVTQQILRDTVANITARLVSAFEVFAWVMFVLAVLIGAASLASGLVDRKRANALLRLSGATAKTVRRQLTVEVVLIAAGSALVSLPVGWLAIVALLDAQAVQSGIRPPVEIPVLLSALSLPLVIACMLLALVIAKPGKANTPLRDLLAQD